MNVDYRIVPIFLLFFTLFVAKADTAETEIVDAGIEVFVPNQREIEFWELLMAHPEHGRDPQYTYLDPLLCKVAREHSRDMFERAYYSHNSPEGVTPNQRLYNAGWKLISQYRLDSNNVESIGPLMTNRPTTSLFYGYLDSPPHRRHVLAEGVIGKEATAIGIGIYVPPQKSGVINLVYGVFLSSHPDPDRFVTCHGPQIEVKAEGSERVFQLSGESLTVGAPYMIQCSDANKSNTIGNWKPYILIRPTRRVEGLISIYRTQTNEEQQKYFRIGFLDLYPPRDFYWGQNTYVNWPPRNR